MNLPGEQEDDKQCAERNEKTQPTSTESDIHGELMGQRHGERPEKIGIPFYALSGIKHQSLPCDQVFGIGEGYIGVIRSDLVHATLEIDAQGADQEHEGGELVAAELVRKGFYLVQCDLRIGFFIGSNQS